jgi:hypothetical protein
MSFLDLFRRQPAPATPSDVILYPQGSPQLTPEQISAYEAHLAPLEERFIAGLEKLVWLKVYQNLPVEQRQDVMQRVVDLYAEVFEFNKAAVLVNRNRRPISLYSQGAILLDTRMIAALQIASHTVLHEGTHHFQRALVNRMRRGEILVGDPRYPVAKVWEYNFTHYQAPTQSRFEAYERQPVEFFANRFANRMMARVSFLQG